MKTLLIGQMKTLHPFSLSVALLRTLVGQRGFNWTTTYVAYLLTMHHTRACGSWLKLSFQIKASVYLGFSLHRQEEQGSYLFFSPGSESTIDDLGSMHQIWGWLFISFMESCRKTDIEIEMSKVKKAS